MPKLNISHKSENELSNGHTHMFMISDQRCNFWGEEFQILMDIADNISKGSLRKREEKFTQCKKIFILLAEHDKCVKELKLAVESDIPIIVVKGWNFNNRIIDHIRDIKKLQDPEITDLLTKGHWFPLESEKSEDLASCVHFLLTVTPW